MATYKVIQDIEAADHIIGRLTFRQFIYAIVASVCLFFCYLVISKGLPFLLIIFLPPALFTAFFAFPWGRDQPTEVWALAKIRFFIKPHKRIWDQSGTKELVTITAPKHIEEDRTNGLSQLEVKSRLSALANTIDSRGWAIKNINLNLYSPQESSIAKTSDRLVDINTLPHEVPNFDVQAADDMLDVNNNPVAHQFDQMINASSQAHRQQIVNMLNLPIPATPLNKTSSTSSTPPADYWFLNQPASRPNHSVDQVESTKPQVLMPSAASGQTDSPKKLAPTVEEKILTEQIRENSTHSPLMSYSHMHNISPLATQSQPTNDLPTAPTSVTPQTNPAILNLANNNDLDVATIARQADISNQNDEPLLDEVVISLR